MIIKIEILLFIFKIIFLYFLLHLSKANFSKLESFVYFMEILFSIEVKNEFASREKFDCLFNKIIKNKKVHEFITNVVYKITKIQVSSLEIERTKLYYFNCDIERLNAFAGHQKIYVSSSMLERFANQPVCLSNSFKETISSLNFIRIIMH